MFQLSLELILDVKWNRMWICSQISCIEDVLTQMGGKLKIQTLNQWYIKVCDHTFLIQLNRKDQLITISELMNKKWDYHCIHYSFFSFEVWLEAFYKSKSLKFE